MAKKGAKRKTTRRKSTAAKESHDELMKILIQNLVELQKINVDLSAKFDKLAKEISHLLALFEIAAKNFAKSMPVSEYEKDKEFLEKIDKLLEQNRTIAKGLMLMEERLREKLESEQRGGTRAAGPVRYPQERGLYP
ncbi:hypothetical protein D6817_00005 [Candidatus Pacearchaeota archaeon]|nr:MAG: hypothetical protein D6817_00005 [Candidatus Pacearchaeota archaeon]